MNGTGPGWVDAIAKAVSSKDEKQRAEALGYVPRRCFRIDRARLAASASRGGRIGGGKRKMKKPLFEEDET